MGKHHALGIAGRARRVGEQREIILCSRIDLALDEAGILGAEVAAGRLDLLERFEERTVVLPHAERVVIDQKA